MKMRKLHFRVSDSRAWGVVLLIFLLVMAVVSFGMKWWRG
jgi:hypothetical protein